MLTEEKSNKPVISSNSLLPIGFVITLIGMTTYGEHRLSSYESENALLKHRVEILEKQEIPPKEVVIKLQMLGDQIKRLEAKIDNLMR